MFFIGTIVLLIIVVAGYLGYREYKKRAGVAKGKFAGAGCPCGCRPGCACGRDCWCRRNGTCPKLL